MVRKITIELLNDKALKLLEELENLQLIRLHKDKSSSVDWIKRYKGAMSKQPLELVDEQLKELRSGWK